MSSNAVAKKRGPKPKPVDQAALAESDALLAEAKASSIPMKDYANAVKLPNFSNYKGKHPLEDWRQAIINQMMLDVDDDTTANNVVELFAPETVEDAVTVEEVDKTLERVKVALSICESGVTDTKLKTWNTDTHCLANRLKQFKVGKKDGAYFVRYGNGTIRSDKAAPDEADVLVLDGDLRINSDGEIVAPAPDPALVSEILVNHRVSHVIYSSFSNGEQGPDYYKYRVLIFIKYNRQQLPVLLDHFHELLHGNDCLLFNVKENRTWSQPWFFPRCSAERKHLFKFYEFLDGDMLDANAICAAYEAAHPVEKPKPVQNPNYVKDDYTGGKISPIDLFNQHWRSPVFYLQSQGYRCRGARLLPPHCSDNSVPGVQICQECRDGVERIYSHHGNDPISDGFPHDSFDCHVLINYGTGDQAFQAALLDVARSFMINGKTLEQHNRDVHNGKTNLKSSINWNALEHGI